jgi:hypothetical protein
MAAAKVAPVAVVIDASGCSDKVACVAECTPFFMASSYLAGASLPDGGVPPATHECPYVPEPGTPTPDGGYWELGEPCPSRCSESVTATCTIYPVCTDTFGGVYRMVRCVDPAAGCGPFLPADAGDASKGGG